MSETQDLFNIVVLGGMNPLIHTPGWYRLVDLIDQDSMDLSVKSPETMSMPMMSQVYLNGVLVLCQLDRWEIQTRDPGKLGQLKRIATQVFDKHLPYTPVGALGFNFVHERESAVPDIGRYLAKRLGSLPLGIDGDNHSRGEFTLKRSSGNRSVQVNLSPAKQECTPLIKVMHNYEYKFEHSNDTFNLDDTIGAFYDANRQDAEDRTSSVLKAIAKEGS